MKNTTLCYIEKDGCYLMIHRTVKKNDGNDGKWLGIGGHFEENESPYDCAKREVFEETSLKMNSPIYRAVVTFCSDKYETEQMHLFTCTDFSGEVSSCSEGTLAWIRKSDIKALNIWEGDLIFLDLIDTCKGFFSLKLVYHGNELTEYYVNGEKNG